MTDFLLYDAKVAAALLVFYLFYRFLLKKETFHRFNRIVLVGTAVLSFLLPLCIITIHKPIELAAVAETPAPVMQDLPSENLIPAIETSAPWWPTALAILFWAGCAFVLLRGVVSILSIARIVRSGEIVMEEDGCKVIVTERNIDPFSWMKYIVLSREDWEGEHAPILAHEKAHIGLGHSVEVLLVDVLSALQWFNPAIWMLRSDLQELHEYEADDAVLRAGTNLREYQYLLIRKAVSKSGYSVANSLNHSILKNRITMMSKSRSPLSRGLRVLWLLPLVCLAIGLQARTVYVPVDKDSEKNAASQDTLQSRVKAKTTLKEVTVVKYANPQEEEALEFFLVDPETMPSFQGGDANRFADWVNQRLIYPRNCTHSGTMEVRFAVSADGSVRDVVVRKSVCPELDAAVITLISKSPKWTPATDKGKPVSYGFTIPFNFIRKESSSAGEPTTLLLNVRTDGTVETNGKTIPVKEIAAYIRSRNLSGPGTSVLINADAGTPMGVIGDVKDELREARALKVYYAKSGGESTVTRRLPPSPKEPGVLSNDEAYARLDRKNACIVRINANDRIFFKDGAYDKDEDLLRIGKAFLREHGVKTCFVFTCYRGTSYGAYQNLQGLFSQIYNDVRDEKAREVYGKSLSDLSPEELSDIQKRVPMNVFETDMKG